MFKTFQSSNPDRLPPGVRAIAIPHRLAVICALATSLGACSVLPSVDIPEPIHDQLQAREVHDRLDFYRNRPVSQMVPRYGMPDMQYDVGNGNRIYQWRRAGGCRISVLAGTLDTSPVTLDDWTVSRWYYEGEGCA